MPNIKQIYLLIVSFTYFLSSPDFRFSKKNGVQSSKVFMKSFLMTAVPDLFDEDEGDS